MYKYADEELGRAAGRVWTLGRANPIDWEIRTALGTFTTDDRSTWRTRSDAWSAPIAERSPLVPGSARRGVYRGWYGATGWHSGLAVLDELFEAEVVRLAGAKGKHDADRRAYRHGREPRKVTLGGRRRLSRA